MSLTAIAISVIKKFALFIDAFKCNIRLSRGIERDSYNVATAAAREFPSDVVRAAISSSMIMVGLATSRRSLTWRSLPAHWQQPGGQESASRSTDPTDTLVSTCPTIFYVKNIPPNSVFLNVARENRRSDSYLSAHRTVRGENSKRAQDSRRLNSELLSVVRRLRSKASIFFGIHRDW